MGGMRVAAFRYRGYPIERLAQTATYEEVAFLLLYGELPTPLQLATFKDNLKELATMPEQIKRKGSADVAGRVRSSSFLLTSTICRPNSTDAITAAVGAATELIRSFDRSAHPMSIFVSSLAALSACSPEQNPAVSGANILQHRPTRNRHLLRAIAVGFTIAANIQRCAHRPKVIYALE